MIDLTKLEQYKENNRIEAKKAQGGLPESIWETYSAFANTLGGIILLGVKEFPDKSLHPIDLPDPVYMVEDFWSAISDPDTVSRNILSEEDVRIEKAEGCLIIVIHVPRADPEQRPIYVGHDLLQGTYKRSGEGDYRCTIEEIYAMLHYRRGPDDLVKQSIIEYLTDRVSGDIAGISKALGLGCDRTERLLSQLIGEGFVVCDRTRGEVFRLRA